MDVKIISAGFKIISIDVKIISNDVKMISLSVKIISPEMNMISLNRQIRDLRRHHCEFKVSRVSRRVN